MELTIVEKAVLRRIYEEFQEKHPWVVSLDAIVDDIKIKANTDQTSIDVAVDSLQANHLIELKALPNMFVLTQLGKAVIQRDVF